MTTFAGKLSSLYRTLRGGGRNSVSFELLFSRFRRVLDDNNRSLEIITDMGDTLGGDYLFDIQYVRRAYADLHAAVGTSLNDFDVLTHNRYPLLRERFLKIDEGIRHVIEETGTASKDLVLFYENITSDMVRDIGGKNYNLAEIRNALKLNVPDAFAVTTRAFDAFMAHNRIFEKAGLVAQNGPPASAAVLHEIRELVLHGEMPPDLGRVIDKAVRKLRSRCGAKCSLAVRSSAGEEDGEFSFAGQFETVLNVPLEIAAVEKAYRKVIASLFSETASIYQERLGYDLRGMKMAVACVVMVDAAKSGVLYSTYHQGGRDALMINATWGIGTTIVEGQTDADLYMVTKNNDRGIIETKIGTKETMVIGLAQGGISTIATPKEQRTQASLSPAQVDELAVKAQAIERYFKQPQDIEWAIDGQGAIFILQSRPLRTSQTIGPRIVPVDHSSGSRIIMKTEGLAVQRGTVAGRVFILKNANDLDAIPSDAILVAHNDSSGFVRVMTKVSAIITDIGAPTSHMATLCREFRIPTVVNTGDATKMLSTGEEITIQVNEHGAKLYRGSVRQLLDRAEADSVPMESLAEFRKKRYLLRYISPLHLIDPLRDDFTPEACRTLHDVLRFIHEKSVVELIESAGYGVRSAAAIHLDLPIPAGIMLIDIGGGLRECGHRDPIARDQIASLPLKAILAGMTFPGIWRSEAVPLNVNDFMTSMLRSPGIDADSANLVAANIAVISKEYVNLSLRFGYHFIVLDCFCQEHTRNNHIYFRFTGGATDMSKRSRRLQLIAAILGEYGFVSKTKGDLIVARLANIGQAEMETILDQIGRLISYTRQLDAVLNDDGAVERFAKNFLDGRYPR